MMTKLLSLVLSFTMIFMSVAPSYAQVRATDEAARRQYDVMKVEDCERDASGKIKKIDFTNPQNRESFERMMSSADVWEWRSCAYVAGLKEYYETHPRQREALTYWHRHDVIYAAVEKYITRWNNDPSARENDTFRSLMVGLNAVVLEGKETTTVYQFNSQRDIFARVIDPSQVEERVNQAREAGRGGVAFGLLGGTGTGSAGASDLMTEVSGVYQLLTQVPDEGASSDISYEEFARLYKDNMKYDFSGRLEEEAAQHQNAPGWSNYVAGVSRQLEGLLSEAKIREAYQDFLTETADGNDGFQAVMQEYLKGLSREIWAAYEQKPAVWLGVLQDVFPVLNMYGGLPADMRQNAAAVMRAEIQKAQSECAKPGFFSMRTLKGLGVMLTLHQNQSLKDSIVSDIVKANGQCAFAVKAAVALGALGAEGDNTPDSQAVQTLFKEGFNGSAAGMVVPAALTALTAMGAYENAADMIIYAGNKTEEQEIGDILGGLSPVAWIQMFQSGNSHWSEVAHLEYSYYQDENGEQRNIWVDTADLLVQAYLAADREEQAKMDVLFRKSLEGLLAPSEKQLRMALRPFLAGVFSHGFINVKLSAKDKGYVAYDQLEVLVDINRITDKKGKKGAKEMFKNAYQAHVPYAGVIIWYLFCSNKDDLHPKMRLYLNERLAQALQLTGGEWFMYANQELEKQEAELQGKIDNFNAWTRAKAEVAPLDDLIGIFFLWQGGKGVFSLLKFIGRMAGTAVTNVVKMLRMMRSVNIVKVAHLGKNLNKVLKLGLTNFKSASFNRLKVSAFRRVKGSPEIPSFKPGAAPAPKGASAVSRPGVVSAPANEAAAVAPKAEIRVLNGEQYVVFEGTETVYVQGSVQVVDKGLPLSDIARQFGVSVEDVAWATDGSSWAGIRSPLNYGAGEAVAGSRGVQPRLDRPEIRIPEPVSRVETPAAAVSPSPVRSPVLPKVRMSKWTEPKALWRVRWDSFKLNTALWWNFTVKNPFRAAGMGTSLLSMGGAAPVEAAFVAEAPSFARSLSAYEWLAPASDASFAARLAPGAASSASVAPAAASSSSAMELTAAAANSGVHSGRMFLNPFWLFGGATSSHITPVGSIPFGDRRIYVSRSSSSKWDSALAFNQYKQQLNNWLYRSNPLYRAQNPWPVAYWWEDVKNSISLGWQEFNLNRHGNPAYMDYVASLPAPQSPWAGRRAFNNYYNQAAHWLYGANPLSHAQNPWPVAHWWNDVKNSVSLGWQEFNLTRAGNPDYTRLEDSFEYTRQQDALRHSLGIQPAAAPAGSGILYSGVPVFAMAKWGKRTFKNIIRYFSREKALPKENAKPGEFNTVYTDEGKTVYRYRKVAYKNGQIRILGDNENAPAGWDLYTLAESYNFMPVASDENALHANTLSELILRESSPVRKDLVFVLASGANQVYKIRAFNKLRQLQYSMPTEAEIIEVSQELDDVTRIALSRADALDIEDSMQRVVSEGGNAAQMAGSEHHVLLEGVSEEDLLNINKNKVSATLYEASEMDQFLGQMQVSTTRNGHTKYSGLLPIYLRLADRSLSEGPRLYFVLNKGQSFVVPRGFVLAMDEKGQMKFVAKDSEAAIRNGSRSLFKFLDKSIRLLRKPMSKRGHVVFEQPLALAELAGLARVLAADTKASKVGVVGVRQQDSFESLMLVVALVAGADLGASMAGEFKSMFEDWASAAIFISGFGYLSPILANLFNPLIAKHGYYQTVKAVLLTMVGISTLGVVGGLTGTFSLKEAGVFGETVSYLFAPVAILMASILSTISSPIMKSAYKDPTQYAAKNMGFTTMKGFSRAIVTLLPWVVGLGVILGTKLVPEGSFIASLLPRADDLNWSLLVPVMLGGSLFGFHLLQKSRLATEASEVKTSPISKQEAKQIYNKLFKPGLASTVTRVALVYFTYAAINSVIFSGEMKMLYPDNGLAITAIGLGMSFAVRKLADWMIKNKVITDDQLTGIGLPLMLFGVIAYLASPAGSIGMWLSWAAMYLSTPVFGVVENSRMMNKVGRYYAAERERIRKDKKMTADEKKQATELSKKVEEAVKLQAAGAYNSANSKGLYPILLLTALFLFLKDLPAVAATAQPWMNAINSHFGDPANDYAIYRLGAVLSVFTASLLVKQNWGMIKDGWSRLFRSVALSQKTIDAYNRGEVPAEDVYKSLRFDTDAMATNLQRITTEINELQVSVRGSMSALESEPRLQKLMNRLVWVNNRLKASLEGSRLPVDQAVASLHALRSSAVMFEKVLEFNDVSDGLRTQAAAFVQSVRSIRFAEDAVVETLTQKVLSYSSQVRNVPAFMETVSALEESYLQGDLKRFKLHYDSLKRMLRGVELDKEVDRLYQSVVKTMESGVYNVQNMNLGYLPEVKMSLGAHFPGLAREAKSIFDGTDVSDYERVKVGYLRTLKILLEEKQNGSLYDGMNGDFALYYQKAVETLDQYAASTDDAERVQELRSELDQVYTAYMGEAPTASSVAAHAAQNSGLWDALTKWWNAFISWIKGGDSSGNTGPQAPADGPNLD